MQVHGKLFHIFENGEDSSSDYPDASLRRKHSFFDQRHNISPKAIHGNKESPDKGLCLFLYCDENIVF